MAGRPEDVSDDELIAVIEDSPDPVLSTSEVASEVPIKRDGVRRRLRELYDRELIKGKKIGGRYWVWWVPTDTSDQSGTETTEAEDS